MQPVSAEALPKLLTVNELTLSFADLRSGFYATHLPMFDELCDTADEQLFDKVQTNVFPILHSLLPPESQPHRTTVSDLVSTICSYRIMLIISLTVTFSCGCFLKTFTNILFDSLSVRGF